MLNRLIDINYKTVEALKKYQIERNIRSMFQIETLSDI